MKKTRELTILIVLGLAVLVFGIFIASNQAQISKNQSLGKKELLAAIKEYRQQAEFHDGALGELLKIAKKAKYNLEAIKFAAYIIANIRFNTLPVLQIAKIAGNANHEVGHLNDLLEVVIIYGGESANIVNLAKMAADNKISETDLVEKITSYRNKSQAKTVDEVIQNGGILINEKKL